MLNTRFSLCGGQLSSKELSASVAALQAELAGPKGLRALQGMFHQAEFSSSAMTSLTNGRAQLCGTNTSDAGMYKLTLPLTKLSTIHSVMCGRLPVPALSGMLTEKCARKEHAECSRCCHNTQAPQSVVYFLLCWAEHMATDLL